MSSADTIDTIPAVARRSLSADSLLLSLEEQRASLPKVLRTAVHNILLRFVSVHGSIGAGKTTLLLRMAERGFPVILENVASWKNVCGYNLLDLYYTDRTKHALAFQMEVIRSRYHDIIQLTNDETWLRTPSISDVSCRNARGEPIIVRYVFTERDFFSCTDVFGKSLERDGCLPSVHLCLLEKTVVSHQIPFPEHIIYLNIPVDICISRTHTRGRVEESKIENTKKLFEDLDQIYFEWMQRMENVIYVDVFGLDEIDRVIDDVVLPLLNEKRATPVMDV